MKLLYVVIMLFGPCFFQTSLPLLKVGGKAASGGGTVNCGYSAATPASTDNNANLPQAVPCTTGSNTNGYSVASISWYAKGAAAETLDLGVYTSTGSGASLVPSTLICHVSFSTTSVIGYNTHAITGCGTLSLTTTYFVAFIDNGVLYGYDAGNCPGFSVPLVAGPAQGSTLLPTPYGTTSTFGECQGLFMTLNVL